MLMKGVLIILDMKNIFLFILLISSNITFSQFSFSKELFFQNSPYVVGYSSNPQTGNDNYISTAIFSHSEFAGIVFLSENGTPIDYKKTTLNNESNNFTFNFLFPYCRQNDWHLMNWDGWIDNTRQGHVLIAENFELGIHWAYLFESKLNFPFLAITNDSKVIYPILSNTSSSNNDYTGFTLLDLATGSLIWSNFYINTSLDWDLFTPISFISLPNSGYISLCRSRYLNTGGTLELLKIDQIGNVLKSVNLKSNGNNISHVPLSEMNTDQDGNIYVPAGINNPDLGYNEALIIKLDSDLNFIWAKRLHAENFSLLSFNIKTFQDGSTVFSYATFSDLPIIVGKISSEGQLLWHRGYGFFDPRMGISRDSSIVFYTYLKYLDNGETAISNILVKTTPDGEIEGCPQFDACIELIDIDIQTEEVHWVSEPAPMPVPVEITVSDGTFTTQDYCGTPPPPTADFMLPDTICQYECLVPDSTNNRYAHHVEWHITGESTDTIIADTTFTWCFEEAGTYFVEQEIWLLGCSEVYMHRLTVLSDGLTSPLGEDRTICDELPVELIPASSRPLKSFLWDDGSQTESRLLTASGTYYLTATDGYCSIEDTVTLNVLQETIHPPFLDIPNDTLLCPDLLPLTLYPTSIYTDTFFLNDGTLPSNEINIYEAGDHSIWASIQGCLFEENIHVEIEPCKVPVFLPNAFSPNDDGINDFLYLLGEDFDPVKIQVFDRWGGLIYASDIPPIRWDGNAAGKELDAGVYLVSFTYFNKRNRREELLSKDVLLVR